MLCRVLMVCFFFFSSRRRHTRYWRDWSSDVCSSDLDDVRATLTRDGHGGLPGRLVDDDDAGIGGEEGGQTVPDGGVVVDDQDVQLAHALGVVCRIDTHRPPLPRVDARVDGWVHCPREGRRAPPGQEG